MLDRIVPAVWPPIAIAIETVAKTFPNTGVKLVKRINGNRQDVDVYLTSEDFKRVESAIESPEFYAWMDKHHDTLRRLATERFGDFDKPVKTGRKQAGDKPEKIKKEKGDKPIKVSAREQRATALAGATPVRMVPVPSIPVPMVDDARAKVRAEIAARRAAAGM